MRRALVIGATGFIGLNVVDALQARGVSVRATWRKKSITVFAQKRNPEWCLAELDDTVALEEAMRGCDVVFFAGGHYPRYSLDRRASIERGRADVRAVCTAAMHADVPRVVYTSSIGTLDGSVAGPVNADDRTVDPPRESVYRATKWAMEEEVDFALARGLDVVTVLPGACLGPWDVRLGTTGVLVALLNGALPWWVDGIVNVADVRDVAAVHVAAAEVAPRGARYAFGGVTTTMRALFEDLARRWGVRFPPEELDVAAAYIRADVEEAAAAPRRGRVPMPRELVDLVAWGRRVDSSRAALELGVVARDRETTLEDARQWLERMGHVPRRAEATAVRSRNSAESTRGASAHAGSRKR
ncbi:MAG: NAD(P)H-binding protein [Sandaracinus sp.]|nr:NAD(P)H-binding protein [Sandaracinus sp.]MCB9621400.1 NAD(P)H-binding protein [Sandaracinus sp.]